MGDPVRQVRIHQRVGEPVRREDALDLGPRVVTPPQRVGVDRFFERLHPARREVEVGDGGMQGGIGEIGEQALEPAEGFGRRRRVVGVARGRSGHRSLNEMIETPHPPVRVPMPRRALPGVYQRQGAPVQVAHPRLCQRFTQVGGDPLDVAHDLVGMGEHPRIQLLQQEARRAPSMPVGDQVRGMDVAAWERLEGRERPRRRERACRVERGIGR